MWGLPCLLIAIAGAFCLVSWFGSFGYIEMRLFSIRKLQILGIWLCVSGRLWRQLSIIEGSMESLLVWVLFLIVERGIRWILLDVGRVKVGGKASGGVCIRDSFENLILEFAYDIGPSTIMVAEVRASMMGVELAWTLCLLFLNPIH